MEKICGIEKFLLDGEEIEEKKVKINNTAICIIRNWLGTEFKGGKYQERIEMIEEIEKENMK